MSSLSYHLALHPPHSYRERAPLPTGAPLVITDLHRTWRWNRRCCQYVSDTQTYIEVGRRLTVQTVYSSKIRPRCQERRRRTQTEITGAGTHAGYKEDLYFVGSECMYDPDRVIQTFFLSAYYDRVTAASLPASRCANRHLWDRVANS